MTDNYLPSLEPYAGEPIVQKESFLRRLPLTLGLKDRLTLDAVVIAADILALSFGELRRFSLNVIDHIKATEDFERAFAIGHCWTLVDQMHAVRQLIRSMGSPLGPYSQRFMDLSAPASTLRNKMDHLSGNLANLSEVKGKRSPLFGSISFFVARDVPPTGGHVATIMSGAIYENMSMPLVNPAGRTLAVPVDLFTFAAFGIEFEFGPALAALKAWVEKTATGIENDVREQVAKYAQESGEDLEKLMGSHGGGLAIVTDLEFSEPAQKTAR